MRKLLLLLLLGLSAPSPAQDAGKELETLRAQKTQAIAEKDAAATDMAQAEAIIAEAQRRNKPAAEAAAREALDSARQAFEEAQAAIARLDARIRELEAHPRSVPDFSLNPEAVKRLDLRIQAVDRRLKRLGKAVDLLGDGNPEWAKEWDANLSDLRRDSDQLFWVGLDLLTMDLAEAAVHGAELDLEAARKAFGCKEWEGLAEMEKSLLRLQKSWAGKTGDFDAWVGDVARLRKAAEAVDPTQAAAALRDLVAKAPGLYHHAEQAHASAETLEQIHAASVILFEVGVVLVKGAAHTGGTLGHLAVRATEAGLLIKLVREEEAQFEALKGRSFERKQKKLELMQKMGELEEEKRTLEWARQKAGG